MREASTNARRFLTRVADTDGENKSVHAQASGEATIFDPSANVAQQNLENLGWKVGTLVAHKKVDPEAPKADEQFDIGHANDDGTIGLHPLLPDGTVDKAKVVMTDQVQLQKSFKRVDGADRLSKLPIPSDDTPTLGPDFWMGVAMQAIVAASYQYRKCPAASIYIQKNHVKGHRC